MFIETTNRPHKTVYSSQKEMAMAEGVKESVWKISHLFFEGKDTFFMDILCKFIFFPLFLLTRRVYLCKIQFVAEKAQPRGVAQSGSVRALGAWGRRFESSHPDQSFYTTWLLGQVVKTPPFHGGNRGSSPLGVTIFHGYGPLAQLVRAAGS